MAAFTLFDIVYRVARELNIVTEGTATAGATTNITDTVGLQNEFVDDYFNGGAAFVLYDAAGAGAAPQGEWARISDFDKATGVATITPALTVAVAANDRYGLTSKAYPRETIISKINEVLADIQITRIDDTTIDTDSDQTDYTLPTTILDGSLEVYFDTNDTADEHYWVRSYAWTIQEEETGTQKILIFNDQPPEPYDLRVVYKVPHPPLYASDDELRETININRVVAVAAYRCLLWKQAQHTTKDAELDRRVAEAYARAEAARWKHPTAKDEIKLNTLGIVDNFS